MITPQDQQKADSEAARLDITDPIPAVGQGPIPRPSRVDEGRRRAAAEPLIEPDTTPPFARVESENPFLVERVGEWTVRIYLDNGEFTADCKRDGSPVAYPLATWEDVIDTVVEVSSDIARAREMHRILGMVLAKLDAERGAA